MSLVVFAKLFSAYIALIFLANILCVHVRKSDEIYASQTWCTHAKKKKKNATESDRSCLAAFDFPQRSFDRRRRGPPMCSPFFLAKRDHLISSPCFGKRNAFLRVGKAQHDRFE